MKKKLWHFIDDSKKVLYPRLFSRWCASNFQQGLESLLGKKITSLDELVATWNAYREKHVGEGTAHIEVINDGKKRIAHIVFEECGCPFVRLKLLKLSPELCGCTIPMQENLFKNVLGKPFKVEMQKAIGRGDEICEFYAHPE